MKRVLRWALAVYVAQALLGAAVGAYLGITHGPAYVAELQKELSK